MREELTVWGCEFLLDLYRNELAYADDVYAETGLAPEVKAYVRCNANKALMNLGLETMFPDEEINPIVMNGIRNEGTTCDFSRGKDRRTRSRRSRRSRTRRSCSDVPGEGRPALGRPGGIFGGGCPVCPVS